MPLGGHNEEDQSSELELSFLRKSGQIHAVERGGKKEGRGVLWMTNVASIA